MAKKTCAKKSGMMKQKVKTIRKTNRKWKV